MFLKKILMASAVSFAATGAHAGCAFENTVPLKSLTDAMAECGNFEANLDQDFCPKQPEGFAANPSLYNIGGVANATPIPLLGATMLAIDNTAAAIPGPVIFVSLLPFTITPVIGAPSIDRLFRGHGILTALMEWWLDRDIAIVAQGQDHRVRPDGRPGRARRPLRRHRVLRRAQDGQRRQPRRRADRRRDPPRPAAPHQRAAPHAGRGGDLLDQLGLSLGDARHDRDRDPAGAPARTHVARPRW